MSAESNETPRLCGASTISLVRLTYTMTLLASLGVASPLSAAPSAPERETARSLMAEGDRLADAGDVRAAMARYASAHAIMHVPTTGLALASVQAKLGLLVEARATAIEVLNLPIAAGDPTVFAAAKTSAANLAEQLEPRVPSVRVAVVPADAAYTLTIDAVTLPIDARGAPYRCNPGKHSLRVEAPGYAPRTLPFELSEGQLFAPSLTLQPLMSTTPVAVAHSAVSAPEGSAADGGGDASFAGRTRAIVGFSVGGVALIAGSVAGIVSASRTSSLKEACPNDACGPRQRSALSSSNTLANLANIAIPLGVIGVGYGVFELLSLPGPNAERANEGSLHVAMTGTGAVIGGSL
jgi:hypothetical protein